jgi:myo-inositol-1-phosphate synthase
LQANHLLYKPILESPKGEKAVADGEKARTTEHPDHVVSSSFSARRSRSPLTPFGLPQIVIKYLPAVGDDKRALDEYNSEIMMGGRNTLNIFNECQDSLLATPLIIDLVLLAELLTRVTYRSTPEAEFENMYSVLGLLSYMLKVRLSFRLRKKEALTSLSPASQAPLTKPGVDVINSLNRQRGGELSSSASSFLLIAHSLPSPRSALEAFLRACVSLQPASDLINFTQMQ